MKALSMYVWSLLVIMMMGFTSCGDDDELQFSEEQLAYINKNKEYIWEKKAEKERQRNEHTAKIGAERLRLLIPSNAKAVILSVNYG